jgi:chromosome partitioning protein
MPVMLGDVDKQQSTQAWLKLRSTQVTPNRSPLVGWTVDPKSVLRAPTGVSHVVLDTPGGLRGFDLARVAMFADAILMPVCNSVFDRESAAACYAEMMTLPRIASGRCVVAAIGMRLDARTKAGEVLHAWAEQQKLPFLGVLRETQNYVRCIERGLTLFDLPPAKVQDDLDQWRPIIEWLQPILRPAPRTEAAAPAAAPVPAPDSARFESLRPAQVSLSLNRDQTLEQLDKVAAAAAPRAGVMNRVGSLLGSLTVPRFLQR